VYVKYLSLICVHELTSNFVRKQIENKRKLFLSGVASYKFTYSPHSINTSLCKSSYKCF